MPGNRVDAAMAQERPAKDAVRALWVERVVDADASHDASDVPLYVTLPGEGRELELLEERGIFRRLENRSIHASDARKLVLIEARQGPFSTLSRNYTGMKIIRGRVEQLLRHGSLLRWPDAGEFDVWRARIINLDLTEPWECELSDGQLRFPVAELVRKIAVIRKERDQRPWELFLTLNATLTWGDAVIGSVQEFLRDNFESNAAFAQTSRELLGAEVFEAIRDNTLAPAGVDSGDCQRLLMTLVPKALVAATVGEGWRMTTRRNLCYGGSEGTAPMVTWLFEFEWDTRASTRQQVVYGEGLAGVHTNLGAISASGHIGPPR